MSSTYQTIVTWVTAAVYAGFAFWLGVWPAALLDAFEVATATPAMLTEIRSFYGGIEMGIALSMILLWRRGDQFAALLIGGLPLAGSAACRCIGLAADGFSALHAGLAFVEAIGAASCLAGCLPAAKSKVPVGEQP